MWLVASALLLAGLGLVFGALLHPRVGPELALQREVVGTHAAWAPAHWLLTLAQAGALLAMILVRESRHPIAAPPWMRAGLGAGAVGMLLGVVGTSIAASGLPVAARDETLFLAVAFLDLAIGWMCLVVACAGGLLAAVPLWAARGVRRALAAGMIVGSLGLLAGALLVHPLDWRTHQYVLRLGAGGLGALLLVAGALWTRADA